MKLRNIIIFTATAMFISMAVISCGGTKSENTETPTSEESNSASPTNAKNNQSNDVNDEKSKSIQDEITSTKDSSALIESGLVLFSLVVAIFSIIKSVKCQVRLSRHREEIESLKDQISNFKSSTTSYSGARRNNYTGSASATVSSNECSDLIRRISSLEGELQKILKSLRESQNTVNQQTSKQVVEEVAQQNNIKSGYFGTAICGEGGSGYFKKLLDSREDARFSVQVIDARAEFTPIVQVGAITSIDAMDLAIEFDGVSKNEATDMSVKYNGVAQLISDKWIITHKAVITLKK